MNEKKTLLVDGYYTLGEKFYNNKSYNEAIATIDKALEMLPRITCV